MISWVKDRFSGSRARLVDVCRSRGFFTEGATGGGDADCVINDYSNNIIEIMTESDASNDVEDLTITMLSPLGQTWVTQVAPTTTVDELRSLALAQFNADPSHVYRMLLVRNKRNLRDVRTLADEGVVNKDEILFVIGRGELPRGPEDEALRGPLEADIIQATAHIPVRLPNKIKAANIEEMVATSELQLEMRKILISLAEHSARVLSAGPTAPQITRMLKQRLSSSKRADPRALQGLVDMGFSSQAASRALRIHNGDAAVALEALLTDTTLNNTTEEDDPTDPFATPSDPKTPSDYCTILINLVHAHAERDFQAHPGHLRDLQAMGFSEPIATQALRATGNNHPAACEWLLGERSRSLFELREGLSPDSPVLAALLESPQVQLSLSNPKMLLAYLSMLDSHAALNMWLNDPEASPVLSHILRTYHAEKHALAVNQFSANNTQHN